MVGQLNAEPLLLTSILEAAPAALEENLFFLDDDFFLLILLLLLFEGNRDRSRPFPNLILLIVQIAPTRCLFSYCYAVEGSSEEAFQTENGLRSRLAVFLLS